MDAGPVIHLSWINHLDLLDRLFEEVLLPPAVCTEVLAAPPGTRGLDRIQEALARGRRHTRALSISSQAADGLSRSLGLGETEAIILAEELGADLLVTDDAAARKLAVRQGLQVTETLGLLRAAREQGLIAAVLPLLLELRQLGLWVSDELVQEIRREEG